VEEILVSIQVPLNKQTVFQALVLSCQKC